MSFHVLSVLTYKGRRAHEKKDVLFYFLIKIVSPGLSFATGVDLINVPKVVNPSQGS